MFGDAKKSGPKAVEAKADASPEDQAKLSRAVRAHGNFAEHTPFAFFLIFLAELNGAPTSLVHGGYLSLFIARVLHGSFGIQDDSTAAFGRPVGTIATIVITVSAGLYNVSVQVRLVNTFRKLTLHLFLQLNLGYEPLKSFLRLSK